MAKNQTASFVLTLKLNTSTSDNKVLNDRFFVAFLMTNRLVSHARKRVRGLRQDKRYRSLMEQYILLKGDTPSVKRQRKLLGDELALLRQEYGLSEYQFHSWISVQQHRYKNYIDSLSAQKLATHVWRSVEAILFRKAKTIHFNKFDNINSIEGKNNASGIRFKNGRVHWMGLCIQPQVRKNDIYAREALTHRVKYCRIVRKPMGTTYHYYLQLILEGLPPKKHDYLEEGRVGIDPGMGTEAVVSDDRCLLRELTTSHRIEDKVAEIQRHMDNSRRANNPQNYCPDGTVRKGAKKWVKSKVYKKNQMRLKTLRRRNADSLKQMEEILANEILCTMGSDVIAEKMNYRALQQRAKETRINENGRYQKKKRFGKSIGRHAPSRFLSILERKLGYMDKRILYINTYKFKASQYNHITGTYEKHGLSERTKKVGDVLVQRDLYSAFLIKNALGPDEPDREQCIETFERFVKQMHQELSALMADGKQHNASIGLSEFGNLMLV